MPPDCGPGAGINPAARVPVPSLCASEHSALPAAVGWAAPLIGHAISEGRDVSHATPERLCPPTSRLRQESSGADCLTHLADNLRQAVSSAQGIQDVLETRSCVGVLDEF